MDTLTAALAVLVAIVALRVVAVRVGVPYPTVFVVGGLGLSLVPGLPHLSLEPDLVLLLFLPPLLFAAAFEIPQRELRANIAPVARLAIGLVVFTMVLVAALAQWLIPGLGWPAAFTLGAIVAPTDALAATSVFRRLGMPRVLVTIVEGESLLNDATPSLPTELLSPRRSAARSSCPGPSGTSCLRLSGGRWSARSSGGSAGRSSGVSTTHRSRSPSPSSSRSWRTSRPTAWASRGSSRPSWPGWSSGGALERS